jgi:hypothetical protein
VKARSHKPIPVQDRWLALHLDDADVGQLVADLECIVVTDVTPLLDQVRQVVVDYRAQVPR